MRCSYNSCHAIHSAYKLIVALPSYSYVITTIFGMHAVGELSWWYSSRHMHTSCLGISIAFFSLATIVSIVAVIIKLKRKVLKCTPLLKAHVHTMCYVNSHRLHITLRSYFIHPGHNGKHCRVCYHSGLYAALSQGNEKGRQWSSHTSCSHK